MAYKGPDVRSRHTWTGVDMKIGDSDIEIEEGNVSVSAPEMEIGLIGDWVAFVALASDAAGYPTAAGPGLEDSEVALLEFAGMGVGVADTVVGIRIGDLALEDRKKLEVVAGKMAAVAAAAVDFERIDGKTVDEVVVMNAGPSLVAGTVETVAEHRKKGQGLQVY